MEISEWCSCAHAAENVWHENHLYANYQHSVRTGILTEKGHGAFCQSLRSLSSAEIGNATRTSNGNPASALIDHALHLFHRPGCGPKIGIDVDFRLAGKSIDAEIGQLFLNIRMEPTKLAPTATFGSIESTSIERNENNTRRHLAQEMRKSPSPIAIPSIRWLTKPLSLLRELRIQEKQVGALDELSLFTSLVSLLGLKRRNCEYAIYTLNIYRLLRVNTLCRPHALSTGYADRHCGDSPFPHYGATVNNHSGGAGLPEAIIYASDLELISPASPDHRRLRAMIGRYAPWVGKLADTEISATLKAQSVHLKDLPYPQLQSAIIRRLTSDRTMCHNAATICPCFPARSMSEERS